jgi:hypothetical protein
VGPALNAAMTALNPRGRAGAITTFAQFYAAHIFDPVDATYVNKVNAFLDQYPTTRDALTRLTANFQSNISLACQRIAADRGMIERFFAPDYPRFRLGWLARIRSTGSDFHKGGRQVLILTFGASYQSQHGRWALSGPFQLVYKPSDVEIDCLVAGDSSAINAVVPNFQAQSLFEIFNALVEREGATVPNALPLPTYKVLPRKTLSSQHPGGQRPFTALRDFYGYIEFLSFEETGAGGMVKGSYAFGASDFAILESAGDRPPVIGHFYRQMGQILAIACTFSLKDLHLQNVRIRRYEPHLIDLEVSLGAQIAHAFDTGLLESAPVADNATGGITGYRLGTHEFRWGIPEHPLERYELLERTYAPETFQNRLLKLGPARRLVGVDPASLCGGLDDGLRLLAGAPRGSFDVWWARAAHVLVRDLPYPTSDLRRIRTAIFFDDEERLAQPLDANITRQMEAYFADEYRLYTAGDVPRYLALAPGICEVDFRNLDLPVFYRRVDQLDIVDSRGDTIPIPAQVTMNGAPRASNVGRTTYYANALPDRLRADLDQLQQDPAVLAQRIQALQAEVLRGLGVDALPGSPQFTFLKA